MNRIEKEDGWYKIIITLSGDNGELNYESWIKEVHKIESTIYEPTELTADSTAGTIYFQK